MIFNIIFFIFWSLFLRIYSTEYKQQFYWLHIQMLHHMTIHIIVQTCAQLLLYFSANCNTTGSSRRLGSSSDFHERPGLPRGAQQLTTIPLSLHQSATFIILHICVQLYLYIKKTRCNKHIVKICKLCRSYFPNVAQTPNVNNFSKNSTTFSHYKCITLIGRTALLLFDTLLIPFYVHYAMYSYTLNVGITPDKLPGEHLVVFQPYLTLY